MTAQNLWDAAKAVLKGKFTAVQSYLKKQEKSQMKDLSSTARLVLRGETYLKISIQAAD